MKSLSPIVKRVGIAALILGLSGCAATPSAEEHERHHPANSRTPSASSTQGGMVQGGMMQGGMMQGGNMNMMDMKSMCEMHSRMMNASPEERRKMMESQQGNMSPEMMQKNMDMMQEKCR